MNPDPEQHKVIWLQPTCKECVNHDRAWCQDNVWENGCEECGAQPVKYVIQPEALRRGKSHD